MSSRPLLESFESRRLMSVVPVSTMSDDGAGSLRQAVRSAAPDDTIDLTQLSGSITLTSGQITIDKSLTLLGGGESALTVSGNDNGHIFSVNPGSTLDVQDMTLTHGMTDTSGGAVLNRGVLQMENVTVSNSNAFLYGGGIYSSGTALTLTNCTINGNTVSGALEADGGGLYMAGGTLTLTGCTFNNNTASGQDTTILSNGGPAYGGAVYMSNTADSTMTNCTFGQNSVEGGTSKLGTGGTGYGGAIAIVSANGTTIASCTIAYNGSAGGLSSNLTRVGSQGGGIYSTGGGTLTTKDTLIALNTAKTNPDMVATTLASLGNNLVGVFSGTALQNGMLADLIGTTVLPVAPNLTALGNYGGLTQTFGLSSNSPAVNSGSTDAPATDQRGLIRRDTPDIGAFELNADHVPQIATISGNAVAGETYNQPIAVVDGDNDPITVTSPNLPSWMKIQTVGGVPTLVGKPTELDAADPVSVELDVSDGFTTVGISFKLKVSIPGIDLSPSGLLRLNGTEFDDVLSVTTLKSDPSKVQVFRDGFKRVFSAYAIKKVQLFGFGGDDAITVDLGTVNTSINAGAGNDTVNGGDGNDYIVGDSGNDLINAAGGRDRVDGGDGNDRINGGDGNDILHGGAGRDILNGGAGTNRLFGDDGDDTLISVLGRRDIVYGGAGNDTGAFNKKTRVFDDVMQDDSAM